MKKATIVINGKGGAGKDTLCALAARHIPARSVSAIDPVKELARGCGWTGEKDPKARRFLSDLKRAMIEYNDLPTRYLLEKHREFLADPSLRVLFVHIREADQIDAFLRAAGGPKATLLVTRRDLPTYHNVSDDQAEAYDYDYVFENSGPLERLEADFLPFFRAMLRELGVE